MKLKDSAILNWPSEPWEGMGWVDRHYFFGIQKIEFWSYPECKKWVQKHGIKTRNEFLELIRLSGTPKELPRAPETLFYKTGEWKGWGEFLSTGRQIGGWDYSMTQRWAQKRGIKSSAEWRQLSRAGKIPPRMPGAPDIVFIRTGEWGGWAKFLGTSWQIGGWDYYGVKRWARASGIGSWREWIQWSKAGKIPTGIPRSPHDVFTRTGEWVSWRNFLGTGRQVGGWNYAFAQKWARKSGIKSSAEWGYKAQIRTIPHDIPCDPYTVFTKTGEWKGWGHFLDTGRQKGGWDYTLAKKWARKSGIKSGGEWHRLSKTGKIPHGIPNYPAPAFTRTGEWEDWCVFLGVKSRTGGQTKDWNFDFSQRWAQKNSITSKTAWEKRVKIEKLPRGVPRAPQGAFTRTGEWKGWPHFLGKTT